MSDELILVVDDSADIRDFVVNYVLKPSEYRHLEARNGEEALRLIKSESPDLVITDFQMPRMSGLDLLYKMQEEGIEIPVILMTFHGSEEIAIEVFRLGVKDYLAKPFNGDELLASIERALSEDRLRSERDQLLEDMVVANRLQENHISQLEALFEVGTMLTGLPDSETLMRVIIEMCRTLLNARRATLLLIDDDGRTLRKRAVKIGNSDVIFSYEAAENPQAWKCITEDRPIASEPFTGPSGGRRVVQLCAPLIMGARGLGALCLHVAPGDVSDHQMNLLNTLADYTAIGLEQARQLEERS